MRRIQKQEKRSLDIEMISFEEAFTDLDGHITCGYEAMVEYLNRGAILQTIFYTYELKDLQGAGL